MADDPESKIPKAIRKTKPEPTLEMKTPGGNALRKEGAERQAFQDHKQYNRNRAKAHVKMDKKIASKENVREGTKGILGEEFNKERER